MNRGPHGDPSADSRAKTGCIAGTALRLLPAYEDALVADQILTHPNNLLQNPTENDDDGDDLFSAETQAISSFDACGKLVTRLPLLFLP